MGKIIILKEAGRPKPSSCREEEKAVIGARAIAVTRCCLGRLEKAAASDSGIRSIGSLEKDSSKSQQLWF